MSDLRTTLIASGFVFSLLAAACQPIQRAHLPPTAVTPAQETPLPSTQSPESPSPEGVDTAPESIAGDWEGSVAVANQTLTMLATFEARDGALEGNVRFPQQGGVRVPLHTIVADGEHISFQMLTGASAATFDGSLDAEGNIKGAFSQAGIEGTFQLARAEAVSEASAVEPAEAKPYREEEVTILASASTTESVTLAGTLSLPEGDGPFPALVLVTGSGPQDRNEDMSIIVPGFQPFSEIADALTRAGYAVLRYDERGVGKSTGDFNTATTRLFADDAEAVLRYLRGHSEIDPQRVGLLGHSEGGMVAAMVAAEDPELAFAVSLSGPAVSGAEVLVRQVQRVAETSGATPEQAEQAARDQQVMVDAALSQNREELKAAVVTAMRTQLEAMPPDQIEALGDVDALIERNSESQVDGLLAPWMQGFLRYDPARDLAKSTAPVLAIFGSKDVQVDAEQNVAPMEAALAGIAGSKVVVIEDANHLYQRADTGSVQEYATLAPHLMPELLTTIVQWLDGLAAQQ